MRLLARLPDSPVPFTWKDSLAVPGDRLDYMRTWTLFFRQSYTEALAAVEAPAAQQSTINKGSELAGKTLPITDMLSDPEHRILNAEALTPEHSNHAQ